MGARPFPLLSVWLVAVLSVVALLSAIARAPDDNISCTSFSVSSAQRAHNRCRLKWSLQHFGEFL